MSSPASAPAAAFAPAPAPYPHLQRRLQSYDCAIRALNSLQTNAAVLEKSRLEKQKNAPKNLAKMATFLEQAGVSLDRLDKLKCIHVSGTKGKGSTSAFSESILRQHGLRTGFYSSPHLISVTERIRLNGQPLGQEQFSRHFWHVFDRVCSKDTDKDDRPAYFQFLTVLAFRIFCEEKVDVAVIEVGIGGSYDSTNVLRRPSLCGVTSLGIDHTSVLGDTIEQIAWHKAGILKAGAAAFVAEGQPDAVLKVIADEADRAGAGPVRLAPRLEDYAWGAYPPMAMGLMGDVQKKNASMALQLSRAFVDRFVRQETEQVKAEVESGVDDKDGSPRLTLPIATPFALCMEEALGLRLCSWPCRSQTVVQNDTTFLLDGAHTAESMQACKDWLLQADPALAGAGASANDDQVFRVLIFNVDGQRRSQRIMQPLVGLRFDLVVFAPNRLSRDENSDNTDFLSTCQSQAERCREHRVLWATLAEEEEKEAKSAQNAALEKDAGKFERRTLVIPFLDEALAWVTQGRRTALSGCPFGRVAESLPAAAGRAPRLQVAVTGSLRLCGTTLSLLQPDVCYKSEWQLKEEEDLKRQYLQLASKKTIAKSEANVKQA